MVSLSTPSLEVGHLTIPLSVSRTKTSFSSNESLKGKSSEICHSALFPVISFVCAIRQKGSSGSRTLSQFIQFALYIVNGVLALFNSKDILTLSFSLEMLLYRISSLSEGLAILSETVQVTIFAAFMGKLKRKTVVIKKIAHRKIDKIRCFIFYCVVPWLYKHCSHDRQGQPL